MYQHLLAITFLLYIPRPVYPVPLSPNGAAQRKICILLAAFSDFFSAIQAHWNICRFLEAMMPVGSEDAIAERHVCLDGDLGCPELLALLDS